MSGKTIPPGSFILVSQTRVHLQSTRMDTRRWQRSRSQVRQRQCLWVCSLVEVTAHVPASQSFHRKHRPFSRRSRAWTPSQHRGARSTTESTRPRASASLGPSMPTRRSAGTRRSAFGASLVRACDLGEALAMRKEYGRLYNAHAAAAAKAEAAVADGSGSHTGRAGRAPRPKSRYWAPWWARRPRRRLHQPSPPVRP
jgi:hypothetical protein